MLLVSELAGNMEEDVTHKMEMCQRRPCCCVVDVAPAGRANGVHAAAVPHSIYSM